MEPQDVERAIEGLVRASFSGRTREGLTHYRTLIDAGDRAIPAIRQKLLAADWSEITPPGKIRFLTALLSALRDIDEESCRSAAQEILNERETCHSVYVSRIRSVTAETTEDFHQFAIGSVSVFVLKTLGGIASVRRHLERWWASLPSQDVAGIDRLYVVGDDNESDYWGRYRHVLAEIVSVWRDAPPFLGQLRTEATLYHEVGHHFHRLDEGSRKESETKANAYAWSVFTAAHPKLARWFGPVISALVLDASFSA